jgi:hypothetical protein
MKCQSTNQNCACHLIGRFPVASRVQVTTTAKPQVLASASVLIQSSPEREVIVGLLARCHPPLRLWLRTKPSGRRKEEGGRRIDDGVVD